MTQTTTSRLGACDAATRWFFTFCGVVFAACAIVGFKHFYFEGRAYPGREITPPIRAAVVAHGASMTLWLLLTVVQPLLVASGCCRAHRRFGAFGAAVALAVVLLGVRVGVHSARVSPPDFVLWGMLPPSFMAVPVVSVVGFGVFVALAVLWRNRPDRHRAMIFSANLATLSAAVSRIDALNALYLGTVWETWFGPFFMTQVLGAVLVALRIAVVRRLERPLLAGFVAQAALAFAICRFAPSDTWVSFARGLMAG
jgi:hypothetical protein